MAENSGERDERETEPISAPPLSMRTPPTLPPVESGKAPVTPRNTGTGTATSTRDVSTTDLSATPIELHMSPSPRAVRRPGDPDTLISAPRPAERDELEVKERFRLLEDRIDELDARVRMLERKRPEDSSARSQPW